MPNFFATEPVVKYQQMKKAARDQTSITPINPVGRTIKSQLKVISWKELISRLGRLF
jgi:hypothetical protein